MDSPNSSSMRVLTRPPNPNPTLTPPIPPHPPPTRTDHPSPSSPPNGVVVVGFIGRRSTDVTQLINRVVDANVFGSGNLDKDLLGFPKGDGWFDCRRISYYDDDEKGVLYLQFSSTVCPATEGFFDSSCCSSGFDSVSEEREFGDLQGLLFMFSVCHVIIFIQEGSHFDTQILKRFRILQSAKHAMSPLVKSQTTPPSTSSSHSSSSRSSVSGVSFNNRSPGRSGVILSRNASAISIRSGLGSYASLFPGQCTPVILFVFLDDFSDFNTGTSNVEEIIDTSSLNQSSSLSNLARTSLPPKGSAPVVMLARPVSKSEGGLKKKLQSSLEAQIRFSIKKCRTLAGSETSHAGSRSGAISNSAPLFSLDASKAVALLDIYSNQSGKSLDFATGLVEDVLNGKATSDSLLLETYSQSATQEDTVSVKEFIYRQADILRGRGGMVTNANSGSAAGVGMVAVAAAAAAASAASGKSFTAPELPSVDIWLSSSLVILQGILSAESGCIIESESSKINLGQKNTAPAVEGVVSRVTDNPLQSAVSCLESGKGLNTKFSTLWCQRALPTAKEVYLSDLPACYPTSKHEEQLEKALRAFCSMVKGPAVPLYMKQLENECTSIWSSGRQLCDAVSLTGKPCMHQRHDVETNGLVSRDGVTRHSSGYVFLKACACGRSRLLQSDPFDFETANVTSSDFADCDKILPSIQLPQVKNVGPIQPPSWSLIRVGGAKYYDPAKGLLQSGFCATQKFLLKWKIFLEKPKNQHVSLSSAVTQDSVVRLSTEPLNGSISGGDIKNSDASLINAEELQSGNKIQREHLYENNQTDEKKLSFGRGIPSFTMRKPFSEVVAGSAAAVSGFPPLQSRKQLSVGPENSAKQSSTRDRVAERVHHTADYKGSQQSKGISPIQDTGNGSKFGVNGYGEGNPILQIGSNVVPVNMSSGEKIGLSESLKNVIVYVGFEHECPRGHRFILTTEHLKELGSPYSLSEESHIPSSVENSDNKRPDPSKLGRNGTHGRAHRNSNRMNNSAVRKVRNLDKTKDMAVDGELDGKQQTQSFIGMPTLTESVKDGLHSVSLDDGAFSLLNRNLPIFMDCPHCRSSKNKKDTAKIKFAGTMSQLQRIFLVTPSFPVVLATCPVIQFEESCLPPSVPDREQKLQFTFGCRVILPPESFLSLRLPFVYGVQLEDGSWQSLRPFEYQPEVTAWIAKGTTLQVISKGSTMFDGSSEN
ncbi:uncharacterized protein LOC131332797 isoform X1 [Rhododendron vialii]|uniref:uncharacterized protein LOC131332797 isoform X1 n=1 Tax=Rhododendron vialii TaxID=182163 RepID=UPI00265FDF4E|nr:uncharacterized protein LOC131332797 isoform X1 [Rhododendron vialii]XP_058223148.1 uncharacterized protein LOC131332797 isoform X1 [Rhododendron vialii]XP_058223194.1 uncharacterized protein LOC131332797 isoform X1 [Rhododendron vialii]XP_058223244.1 uncharacterized protein LOC131332797 isoform X1 [Rhododendron vialii]XP_058223296.1 uncharacterized protein LOC131332797 isoform X1 [Rhododendron vialii]XP_058223368.1 uncharacterized protein LOC131332797 isoform X1 [Rhododendron vialii]